ncbi:PH and SEC7 domain-containing protein 4 isoform X1 [Cyprinodon tularosa]|uniref:PH and SEC7 domain-containing protein 4 isoform X1 n=1 Tax=Cyprinodon tularosa TaxID=77115 RepID=UPI0018E24377|nr:PH and SEC7 domain-containing protein 4 isoform X1 [Cyprinodon tularosa]XP_038137969.1 PH and SEC7 domain-containing protein 4 isoform X1 [Cyprinodon tularosa]XP_038137971.1 PH and SEC7 domain-containing protein 4 isoform X1 [Cyprinodon tularosa]
MEEEKLCTSMPDVEEAEIPQDLQASSGQSINGEQGDLVFGDEVEKELTYEEEAASDGSPKDAEQFEETIWSPQPIACSHLSLTFASVGWEMPDSSAENASFMTDSSLANELYSEGMTSIRSTSLSPHHHPQDVTAEPFKEEDKEEQDEVNTQPLNPAEESTGSESKPCDAADVKELTKQEKEDSAAEKSESSNEASDEEEEGSVTSDEDLPETKEKIQCSSEAVDTCLDVKLEKEEEISILLSEQKDSEGEPSLTKGSGTDSAKEDRKEVQEEESLTNVSNEKVPALADSSETEQEHEEKSDTEVPDEEEPAVAACVDTQEEHWEVSEEEEQPSVSNVSLQEESEEAETVSSLTDLEVPAEVLQTDNTTLDSPTGSLGDLPALELPEDGDKKDVDIPDHLGGDLSVLPEEMCEDVNEKVDPELSESDDNNQEESEQAEKAESVENSLGREEEGENLEETPSLESDQDRVATVQPEALESESGEVSEEPKMHAEESDPTEQLQDQPPEMASPNQLTPPETPEDPPEQTACDEATESTVGNDPSEQNEPPQQTACSSEKMNKSNMTEQLSPDNEATALNEELNHVDQQAETSDQAEDVGLPDGGSPPEVVANGDKHQDSAVPHINGGGVDREKACRLAEQLFKLENIQRSDVVKHLDKDNDFSRAVGEEYLRFFDFSNQTLDQALRSFLKVVVLIGETQERERVLQHFSNRFHECNPDFYCSSGAVLALTCALMLLNTDLHGQNVGKSMSSSKFVTNLDGMNEGGNFNKELLKSFYNSIKSEPLEWAVDEEELKNLVDESAGNDAPLRSKSNPFLDVPQDQKAAVVKQGFLQRKLHADINGKRTPRGKRGWKTFFGVLKGMTLYLQKNDYRRDQLVNEDIVAIHHSLAEPAADYTKKPHVFRLQTADWRVLLFQASSKVEMNSWISRINLVSALHSSPPFPAAVGSQRRFFRPLLPASKSVNSLDRQLQCHSGKLDSFKADLLHQQENPPDSKKAKTKDLEEHRVRAEYLQYEVCRYETYIEVLGAWKSVQKNEDSVLSSADLNLFDKAACPGCIGDEDEEEAGLKRSYSSPSLELELAPPTIIKVKRNISERRTYRRTIVPRMNKEA